MPTSLSVNDLLYVSGTAEAIATHVLAALHAHAEKRGDWVDSREPWDGLVSYDGTDFDLLSAVRGAVLECWPAPPARPEI